MYKYTSFVRLLQYVTKHVFYLHVSFMHVSYVTIVTGIYIYTFVLKPTVS